MTNLFKKAATLFGNWTGIRKSEPAGSEVIEPVAEAMTDSSEGSASVIPLDAPTSDWNQALSTSSDPIASAQAKTEVSSDIEAAIAAEKAAVDQFTATPFADLPTPPDQAVTAGEVASHLTPISASETKEPAAEEKPPIELKPTGMPKPSVTFTQLYELISNEVNKRTDNAITVYERLLASAREELNATRRSNRIAWSIGGVMTAVAAFGAVWSAGEVASTRVEVSSLKQQVSTGQQASLERDQLRGELMKVREASAQIEIDALKARLDEALVITSERTKLRGELDAMRKAKSEVEAELKVARAAAATQPVSDARPAAGKMLGESPLPKASASERHDAWSTLLNGPDDR